LLVPTWRNGCGQSAAFFRYVAVGAAFIPVYGEHWAKKSEGSVIAGVIAEEIEFARLNATIIAHADRSQRRSSELIELVPSILLQRTTMIDRFLADLSCLGARDGKIVADACASTLKSQRTAFQRRHMAPRSRG
jgi:hypothetical protein